jgi:hypothetical protein
MFNWLLGASRKGEKTYDDDGSPSWEELYGKESWKASFGGWEEVSPRIITPTDRGHIPQNPDLRLW